MRHFFLSLSLSTSILHPSRPLNCVFVRTIFLSLSLPLFLAKSQNPFLACALFLSHARTISHSLSLFRSPFARLSSLYTCVCFAISLSLPQLCLCAHDFSLSLPPLSFLLTLKIFFSRALFLSHAHTIFCVRALSLPLTVCLSLYSSFSLPPYLSPPSRLSCLLASPPMKFPYSITTLVVTVLRVRPYGEWVGIVRVCSGVYVYLHSKYN